MLADSNFLALPSCEVWPPYDPAVTVRTDTGEALSLDPARWHGPATMEECEILAEVEGPVIDLGCGPGRVVLSLAARGIPALGVDSSPEVVALARARGAVVIHRDLFGPLPGEGRWATVVLFDGNIGIGGDPQRLLTRCHRLTGGKGRALVEVDPPGQGWRRITALIESCDGLSPAFAWALVGADSIHPLAESAGFDVTAVTETISGRWFASLATRR